MSDQKRWFTGTDATTHAGDTIEGPVVVTTSRHYARYLAASPMGLGQGHLCRVQPVGDLDDLPGLEAVHGARVGSVRVLAVVEFVTPLTAAQTRALGREMGTPQPYLVRTHR
jgi:hypothetical protein